MKLEKSLFAFCDRLVPTWSRTIESSRGIMESVVGAFHSSFVSIREFNSSQKELVDAFLLVAADLPQSTQEFVALLGRLSPGGVAVMEIEPGQWRRSQLKDIAASMSAQLRFCGATERLTEQFNLPDCTTKFTAVIEKDSLPPNKKRLTIVLPVLSDREDYPRIREWLECLHLYELFANMELVLIFDGIDDLLPAWKEHPLPETEEEGLQTIRHYRSFGKDEALLTALSFSRSKLILWDGDREIPCREVFALMETLIGQESHKPLATISSAIPQERGWKKKLSFQNSFVLFNRPVAELLVGQSYIQRTKLLEGGWKKLKQNGAKVRFLPAYRSSA